MIDIIVFALPVDRSAAGRVVDGLAAHRVAGPYRTRYVVAHPDDADWPDAVDAVEGCPCVIFCWSRATASPAAEPMTRLAERIHADGHAISVELDAGVRPAELSGCTTYPLYGWRAATGGWRYFLHGDGFVTQIAAAAQEKVLGRDPPAPTAYPRMVRAQAWVVLVGAGTVISVFAALLQIYRDPEMVRRLDPAGRDALAAARASAKPCDALRAFDRDSAYADEATALLATCTKREVERSRPVTLRLEAFGRTFAEAQADGKRLCKSHAANSKGRVISVRIEDFVPTVRAGAICTIDQPVREMEEVFGAAVAP